MNDGEYRRTVQIRCDDGVTFKAVDSDGEERVISIDEPGVT